MLVTLKDTMSKTRTLENNVKNVDGPILAPPVINCTDGVMRVPS